MRYLVLGALLLAACSNDDSAPCDDCNVGDVDLPPPPEDHYAFAVTYTRDPAADPSPFSVSVTLTNNGAPVTGARLNAAVVRGSASSVTERGNGVYTFGVTPNGGGETPITITYGELASTTVTPIVFQHVDAAFNQPQRVDGLVNTPGYEDGASVSPDGRYLFVQYGPVYFSGIILFGIDRADGGCGGSRLTPTVCNHPWIDSAIGPFAAPERPGFFSGRINANGAFRHNSALYVVADGQAPIFAPPTMFYGFVRQPDGTYAEPFYVAFDDHNDAIVNPFGFSVVPTANGLTGVWSLNDDGAGFDVYTLDFTPGANVRLGGYEPNPTQPPRSANFPAQRVSFGDNSGTQGNPMLATEADGSIWAVFTDDEYDGTDSISAYVKTAGTLTSGTWTKVTLPALINTPSTTATQPFLDSDGSFYFRRDSDLVRSRYTGPHTAAGLGTPSNWSTPVVVLQHSTTPAVGAIVVAGEPSVAVIDGERVLFFVYGRIRAVGDPSGFPDIDMQVGSLPLRD